MGIREVCFKLEQKIIMLRNCFMFLITFSLAVNLYGCYGMAHYQSPPSAVLTDGTGVAPVKPDEFEVKSDKYQRYQASFDFKPPKPSESLRNMVEVRKEEIWKITHVIGSRYIIQSDEYNERQCQYLNSLGKGTGGFVNIFGVCLSDYDYGIYITADGKVNGGWELLPSDRIMGANRYMYMHWEETKNEGWPRGVVFEPTKSLPFH
ncbi:MAG: hypothetical protein HY028_02345 [Gammaproteobacteria bacterium]|nr:hypothetical protein [Gammaproteobacteria bacterium]